MIILNLSLTIDQAQYFRETLDYMLYPNIEEVNLTTKQIEECTEV